MPPTLIYSLKDQVPLRYYFNKKKMVLLIVFLFIQKTLESQKSLFNLLTKVNWFYILYFHISSFQFLNKIDFFIMSFIKFLNFFYLILIVPIQLDFIIGSSNSKKAIILFKYVYICILINFGENLICIDVFFKFLHKFICV